MGACLLLGIGAACAFAVLPAGRAQACTFAATCNAPVRLFPTTQAIPGNLIYFKVLVAEPGTLTLRRADGTVIPASVRTIGTDRVFAPDADVPGGQEVRLEYTTTCPPWFGASVAPTQETFSFTTAPSATLEVPSAPMLLLVDQGRTRSHPMAPETTAGFVSLRYQTQCTSCSAAHLTDAHVQVNNGGEGYLIGSDIELLTGCEGLQIYNSCTGEVFSPPGHYDVEAWSSVVGATTQPPRVSRAVTLSCVLGDKSNGGVSPSAVRKYERPHDDDLAEGCSLHGSRSRADALAWCLAGLALAALRRRRPA